MPTQKTDTTGRGRIRQARGHDIGFTKRSWCTVQYIRIDPQLHIHYRFHNLEPSGPVWIDQDVHVIDDMILKRTAT
jgi:hypothetical protein